MRRLISSGSSFERDIGYSRAVVDGNLVFVSGTTGFDYRTMTISADVVDQAEQCMRNIAEALAEAGSRIEDVVRVRYILPKLADFEPCWPVLALLFRGDPACGHHDLGRPFRSPHADRNRGYGGEAEPDQPIQSRP